MRSRIALALAAALACAAIAGDAPAQTGPQPPPDKEAIREIVREYLLEHPEVIEEAIRALSARRQADQAARTRDALVKNRVALVRHPMSPVSGNPEGDVTLVEFFDYQCGYCKRSLEPVIDLLENDPGLRVVWKEFPVLGQVSTFAALASMAAQKQGKYLFLHKALMGARERLTEESVMEIAGQVGLDLERLQRDMADPKIVSYLQETQRLANRLGINGTPAFVIGNTLVPGAVDGARLKQLIAQARRGG
jgi:protein-disulfide isomerase